MLYFMYDSGIHYNINLWFLCHFGQNYGQTAVWCSVSRCKPTKKKVLVARKKKKKTVLSPQRRGNVTSVVALQRKPPVDKKAALKSKIQDILSGRSRFVIRKEPAVGSTRGRESNSGGRATSKVHGAPSVSKSNEDIKKDRCSLHITVNYVDVWNVDVWLISLNACSDSVFPSGTSGLLIPLHQRKMSFF